MKRCTNKSCKRAGELLPLKDFHRRVSNKDGLETRCKDCIRVVNKKNCLMRVDKGLEFESMLIGDKPKYYWL